MHECIVWSRLHGLVYLHVCVVYVCCGGVVLLVIADHTVVQETRPAPTTTVYDYVLPGLWLVHLDSMLCV